jgi:hypothetical protein
LNIHIADDFLPVLDDRYQVVTASSINGPESSNADEVRMAVEQSAEDVSLVVQAPASEEFREQFNAGIAALAETLPEWGTLFDLDSIALPVAVDTLDSLFGFSGDSGLLVDVAVNDLATADEPVDRCKSWPPRSTRSTALPC